MTEKAKPDSPPTGSTRETRNRSTTLGLSAGFVVGVIWFLIWSLILDGIRDRASSDRFYAAKLQQASRVELALRAIAIRRVAERVGHLPQSLADCDGMTLSVDEVLPAHCFRRSYLDWDSGYKPSRSTNALASLGLFDLPILYHRGELADADDSWYRSTDPIPPEVADYLKSHGGIPPVAPEPFALSSLVIRHLRGFPPGVELEIRRTVYWKWGGMAVILPVALILAWRWRRFAPGPVARGFQSIAAAIAVVLGMSLFVSCYARAFSHSRQFSKTDRLRILDEAVRRGELSPEVARLAREQISTLVERD